MTEQTNETKRSRSTNAKKPPIKMDVQLDYPVNVSGVDVTQVTMRRPKVRDEMAAEDGAREYYNTNNPTPAETEVMLISNLCDISPDVIEDMYSSEYQKLTAAYRGFFGSSGR